MLLISKFSPEHPVLKHNHQENSYTSGYQLLRKVAALHGISCVFFVITSQVFHQCMHICVSNKFTIFHSY